MSLSKRHTAIVYSILIAIATCGLTPKSNADIIHESATMGPTNQYPGTWIFEYQFLGSRFEITEPTEITAIGGHIGNDNERFIFGAIVSLDNQNDFPSDTAWMNNLVEWTYFRPNWMSLDLRTPLNVILQPGWYGLVFGAGEFGLTRTAISFMPTGGQAIYPGSSYFHWDGYSERWYNTAYGPGYPRFVVEGQPYIPPVEIYGTKFDDVDGNGNWDPGEPNMPGWEIYLDENGNGTYEPSEPNTVTDSGGMYLFTNLDTPAIYRVREIMKDGWTQTLPGGPDYEHVINAEPNNIYGPYDFGNTDQLPSEITISGYIKEGTTALEGVYVEAYQNGDTPTGRIDYTDSQGYYEIQLPSPWTGSLVLQKHGYLFATTIDYSGRNTDITENINGTFLYGGGEGSQSVPFEIWTAEQMNNIGQNPFDWNQHFKLMAEIDLGIYTGTAYNIIGNYLEPFTGSFDGHSHTITNFTYSTSSEHDIGILGYIEGSNAEIKNLVLLNVEIESQNSDFVGALVGRNSGGTITNCSSSGNVTGNDSTGGLLGYNGGIVRDCHSTANVIGTVRIGGLTGANGGEIVQSFSAGSVTGGLHAGGLTGENEGSVYKCYTNSSVFGTGENTGGFVGINDWGGIISNCYSMSTVSGSFASLDNVGGFAGENGITGEILNCFSTGHVNANTNSTGGLIGLNYSTVTDSFWDKQTSDQLFSAGGSGASTEQMKTMSTFTDAGWDFENLWTICQGTHYPRFQWQVLPADFVCPEGVELNDLNALVGEWLTEKPDADMAPDGGDGFVNALDWARLAAAWMTSDGPPPSAGWDPACDLAPAGGDGLIDMLDVAAFSDAWLKSGARFCDIAPPPDGDGHVDLKDFAAFAEYWLIATTY